MLDPVGGQCSGYPPHMGVARNGEADKCARAGENKASESAKEHKQVNDIWEELRLQEMVDDNMGGYISSTEMERVDEGDLALSESSSSSDEFPVEAVVQKSLTKGAHLAQCNYLGMWPY